MLKKSLRSAFVLSAIGVLAFAITSAILNMLIPALLGAAPASVITTPEGSSQAATETLAVAILLIVVILLITITIGAYWLYRYFGDVYFGPHGAVRWALFGTFSALLFKVPDWVTIPGGWFVKNLFLLAGVFLAFFGARAIIPIRRK